MRTPTTGLDVRALAWLWVQGLPLGKQALFISMLGRASDSLWIAEQQQGGFGTTQQKSLVSSEEGLRTDGSKLQWRPATQLYRWQVAELGGKDKGGPGDQNSDSASSLSVALWMRHRRHGSLLERLEGKTEHAHDLVLIWVPVTWPVNILELSPFGLVCLFFFFPEVTYQKGGNFL